MYFGAGGTHVRCIYDGGILLEWNAEWKCMFKNWDPRKYKIERTLEPEKYIFTSGCTSLQLGPTHSVIAKFK